MRVLYVDDLRNPYKYKLEDEVIIARTAEEAIRFILAGKKFDIIDLDHDLGEDLTGYDICKYIIAYAPEISGEFRLHTANPVGRENMRQLLCRYTDAKITIY